MYKIVGPSLRHFLRPPGGKIIQTPLFQRQNQRGLAYIFYKEEVSGDHLIKKNKEKWTDFKPLFITLSVLVALGVAYDYQCIEYGQAHRKVK